MLLLQDNLEKLRSPWVTHGVNLIISSVPSKYNYIVKNIDGSEEAL